MQRPDRDTAVVGVRRRQRTPNQKAFAPVRDEHVKLILVLAFLAAHVPLALLMNRSSTISTLHLMVTIAGSLWLAISSEKIERVAYAAAYITGAEVLWRMTGAQGFWEMGKYSLAAVLIVAMVRHWRVKPSILPVLYFALLIPSAFLTFQGETLDEARQYLSSNMSGPFALLIAGCFFSQMSLTREQMLRLFFSLIGPVLAVGAVVYFDIASVKEISFTDASNFEASGKFGPNQVSAVMSLGALACFLAILNERADIKLKLVAGGLMILFAAQSALTFSRGGLYNLVGAILLASLFLLKDARTRIQFVLATLVIGGAFYFVVLPGLNAFTNGALYARFEDTGATGREEIVQMDFRIWRDNPILGVGPGRAVKYRADMGFRTSAHTEFTRLLAEHGLFGLAALLVFLAAFGQCFMKAESAQQKALVVALCGWSFLYMLVAGMRLVAPSMMFGLAFAHFLTANKKILTKRIATKKPRNRRRRAESPQLLSPASRQVS